MANRIAEIAARCEAATPGPWYVNNENEGMPQEYSPFWVVSGDSPETFDGEWYMELHCGYTSDADFIAHARTDIPYLLDRLAEAEAEVERLREAQSREKMAVEDLYETGDCGVCKHYSHDNNACAIPLVASDKCFEWRGLEAGEGQG